MLPLALLAAGLFTLSATAAPIDNSLPSERKAINVIDVSPPEMPVRETPPGKVPEDAETTSSGNGYNAIALQGLNKVTGALSHQEGLLGTTMRFGNLEIIARKCWQSPPEEQPENAALLEILELKPGEPPETIFLGWMFSSSPGLVGLEHPVYDITVLACKSLDETEMESLGETIDETDQDTSEENNTERNENTAKKP